MTRLPDKRYSVQHLWCGHPQKLYIAYFCNKWIKDEKLWNGHCPPRLYREHAVLDCIVYENERQKLIAAGSKQQARADFYEANPERIKNQ